MPVTEYIDYFQEAGNHLRLRFTTDRGIVINFTVQYEMAVGDDTYPVVRYDTAHGHAHRDLLGWRGETIRRDPLPEHLTYNEAMEVARRDLKEDWQRYRDDFMRRKP